MELQGELREAGSATANVVTGGLPFLATSSSLGQRPPIPPAPFFHGFPGAANQLPFLYSHSYMPPIPPYGFSAPAQGTPSATIDLTEGSPKRGPLDSVTDHSKSIKKKRAPRKKPDIIELDDAKEDVELLKHAHHWKEHWVIQLISLRGEMQNTFNAPPKQGVPLPFFFGFFNLFIMFFTRVVSRVVCIPISPCLLVCLAKEVIKKFVD